MERIQLRGVKDNEDTFGNTNISKVTHQLPHGHISMRVI